MSAWGGFKRRVHGVLFGWIVGGLFGHAAARPGRGLPIWVVGGFLGPSMVPLVNGSNQAIWQAKVAPDVQGRVFAARRLIAWLSRPSRRMIAGPLADLALEPAMRRAAVLTGTFGWLMGIGPGAGMALLIIIAWACASALVGAAGYLVPAIRDAESLLPDHDTLAAAPAEAAAD